MIKLAEKIYDYIADNWKKKNYGIPILVILSMLILIFCITVVAYFLVSFLVQNMETVATFIVGLTVFILLIVESQKERLRKLEEEQAREEAKRQALQEKANIKAIEENYKMLSRILVQVLPKVSDVLGLKEISTERDIESPVHHINMGDFYLYQFIIYRKAITMETKLIGEVLQEEINRLIGTGQVYGLQKMTHYLYNGQFYSVILIDKVEENVGYLTLSLAIASEEYFKYRQMQSLTTLSNMSTTMTRPYDKDF